MNKNSLLVVGLILIAGILAAYYYKTKVVPAVDSQQQEQKWNDWDKKNPTNPQPPNQPQSEVKPTVPAKPTSYQDAIKIAKATNKSVLLVFGADWCGYCKQLKTTLADAEVQKAMSDFVYYHVDVDKERNVATKYGVKPIPAYKIVDVNEKVLSEGTGYKAPKDFVAWLKSTVKKSNPFKR